MEITIAKGLKLKNKLVRELSKSFGIISRYNSYNAENPPNFDVPAEYTKLLEIQMKLIAVKAEIAKANGPIYDKIYRIAELKSMISQFQRIDTACGTQTHQQYGAAQPLTVITKASFKDSDMQNIVEEKHAEIEKLQDEIDQYNHATKIEVV